MLKHNEYAGESYSQAQLLRFCDRQGQHDSEGNMNVYLVTTTDYREYMVALPSGVAKRAALWVLCQLGHRAVSASFVM